MLAVGIELTPLVPDNNVYDDRPAGYILIYAIEAHIQLINICCGNYLQACINLHCRCLVSIRRIFTTTSTWVLNSLV